MVKAKVYAQLIDTHLQQASTVYGSLTGALAHVALAADTGISACGALVGGWGCYVVILLGACGAVSMVVVTRLVAFRWSRR